MATGTIGVDAGAILRSSAADAVGDLNSVGVLLEARLLRVSANTANTPSSGFNGCCLHYQTSANYGVQLALHVGESTIYIRHLNQGTWSIWHSLY